MTSDSQYEDVKMLRCHDVRMQLFRSGIKIIKKNQNVIRMSDSRTAKEPALVFDILRYSLQELLVYKT